MQIDHRRGRSMSEEEAMDVNDAVEEVMARLNPTFGWGVDCFTAVPGNLRPVFVRVTKEGDSEPVTAAVVVRNAIELESIASAIAPDGRPYEWEVIDRETGESVGGVRRVTGEERVEVDPADILYSGLPLAERVDQVVRQLTDGQWVGIGEYVRGMPELEPYDCVDVLLQGPGELQILPVALAGGQKASMQEIVAAIEWELRARGVTTRPPEEVGLA